MSYINCGLLLAENTFHDIVYTHPQPSTSITQCFKPDSALLSSIPEQTGKVPLEASTVNLVPYCYPQWIWLEPVNHWLLENRLSSIRNTLPALISPDQFWHIPFPWLHRLAKSTRNPRQTFVPLHFIKSRSCGLWEPLCSLSTNVLTGEVCLMLTQ